jgi:hypothetical protein
VKPQIKAKAKHDRAMQERSQAEREARMKRAHQYQHVEAFCIMTYKCTNPLCGRVEVLWNSRDGVTPFTIGCSACHGIMEHVYWDMDRRDLNYAPRDDQRVFIDMTEKHKRAYAEALLAQVRKDGVQEQDQSDEELIKKFMGSFQPGEPTIVSGAEYLQLKRDSISAAISLKTPGGAY